PAHLAAGMWADRRIGDYAVGGALAGGGGEGRRIEPQQQHLVEARSVAHDAARGVHCPRGRLRPAGGNILRLERGGTIAVERNQEIAFLGALVGGLGPGGRGQRAGDGVEAEHRGEREQLAPRRARASATITWELRDG